jgi:hypothetical protein
MDGVMQLSGNCDFILNKNNNNCNNNKIKSNNNFLSESDSESDRILLLKNDNNNNNNNNSNSNLNTKLLFHLNTKAEALVTVLKTDSGQSKLAIRLMIYSIVNTTSNKSLSNMSILIEVYYKKTLGLKINDDLNKVSMVVAPGLTQDITRTFEINLDPGMEKKNIKINLYIFGYISPWSKNRANYGVGTNKPKKELLGGTVITSKEMVADKRSKKGNK